MSAKPDPEWLALQEKIQRLDSASIDALYGLEPVFEPGQDPSMRALDAVASVRCQHCAERFEISVELIFGNSEWHSDCPVCCHPLLFRSEIDDGELKRVHVRRLDD